MRNDFVVFVLSHGRAKNVDTVDTLNRCGYTGKWYIIIDNEDKTADEYYSTYGKDHVLMFDKLKKSKEFDTCDNFEERRAVVYARNASFDFAEQLGYTYFLELDDDYVQFRQRRLIDGVLKTIYVKNLDAIIDEMIKYLEDTKALTIAFSQTGDFIGGTGSAMFRDRVRRKAMNAFFCRTDRRFDFIGRVNEDVNTYCKLGSLGHLMLTIADINLDQRATQQNAGGMSDLYLASGTYVKSFYTVMTSPSCVKISTVGPSHARIHHLVDWEHCVPKIISSDFKKIIR